MGKFGKFLFIVGLFVFTFWFLFEGKSQIPQGYVDSVKAFLTGMVDDFVHSVMKSVVLDVALGVLSTLGFGWGFEKVIKRWKRTARRYPHVRAKHF